MAADISPISFSNEPKPFSFFEPQAPKFADFKKISHGAHGSVRPQPLRQYDIANGLKRRDLNHIVKYIELWCDNVCTTISLGALDAAFRQHLDFCSNEDFERGTQALHRIEELFSTNAHDFSLWLRALETESSSSDEDEIIITTEQLNSVLLELAASTEVPEGLTLHLDAFYRCVGAYAGNVGIDSGGSRSVVSNDIRIADIIHFIRRTELNESERKVVRSFARLKVALVDHLVNAGLTVRQFFLPPGILNTESVGMTTIMDYLLISVAVDGLGNSLDDDFSLVSSSSESVSSAYQQYTGHTISQKPPIALSILRKASKFHREPVLVDPFHVPFNVLVADGLATRRPLVPRRRGTAANDRLAPITQDHSPSRTTQQPSTVELSKAVNAITKSMQSNVHLSPTLKSKLNAICLVTALVGEKDNVSCSNRNDDVGYGFKTKERHLPKLVIAPLGPVDPKGHKFQKTLVARTKAYQKDLQHLDRNLSHWTNKLTSLQS